MSSRSLCARASVKHLGFSVMVMQAGLSDFAEQTVSQRDVEVIALPEQKINALQNWMPYEAKSQQSVQRWADKVAELCSDSLKTKANDFKFYKKLVLKPLVEYVTLARALEYLTEAVKKFEVRDTTPITTEPELGSRIRRAGLQLRDSVDQSLKIKNGFVAKRLTPAVLAPAM